MPRRPCRESDAASPVRRRTGWRARAVGSKVFQSDAARPMPLAALRCDGLPKGRRPQAQTGEGPCDDGRDLYWSCVAWQRARMGQRQRAARRAARAAPARRPDRRLAAGTLLVGMVAVAYLPALWGGFVWDDDAYVTRNAALRSLGGLAAIWFEPGAVPQYYPLTFTSL